MLFTDRLGTVRKITTPDMRPLAHIDTDAWGNGVTRDERSTPGVGQIPNVSERLPGQYADGGRGFTPLENHWRFYLPWTGGYLSPDAEHRVSTRINVGPQAYAYASGRPLVNVDPDGRVTFNKSSYDNYCGEGPCADDDYAPEKMIPAALSGWARPSCRTWWARAFPGGRTLGDLLTGPSPTVYFADIRGGLTYGVVILSCLHARCHSTYDTRTKDSARSLNHELVHVGQTENYGPIPGLLFNTEMDPASGAIAGEAACAPQ